MQAIAGLYHNSPGVGRVAVGLVEGNAQDAVVQFATVFDAKAALFRHQAERAYPWRAVVTKLSSSLRVCMKVVPLTPVGMFAYGPK